MAGSRMTNQIGLWYGVGTLRVISELKLDLYL